MEEQKKSAHEVIVTLTIAFFFIAVIIKILFF